MQIYVSYSGHDRDVIQVFREYLNQNGISVVTGDVSLDIGEKWANKWTKYAAEQIMKSHVFIPILTKNSIKSVWVAKEFEYALSIARDRDKTIIPIMESSDLLSESPVWEWLLIGHQQYVLTEGLTEKSLKQAADFVKQILDERSGKTETREKYKEYVRAQNWSGQVESLAKLINYAMQSLQYSGTWHEQRILYAELLKYYNKLTELCMMRHIYDYYNTDAIELMLSAINSVRDYFSNVVSSDNPFYDALAIYFQYQDMIVRYAYAFLHTNCDVCGPQPHTCENYKTNQKTYYAHLQNLLKSEAAERFCFTEEENEIIFSVGKYTGLPKIPDWYSPWESGTKKLPQVDARLNAIAEYMHSMNKLFDTISDEMNAIELLRCIRTSYTRLEQYCELIHADAIAEECIERIAVLNVKLGELIEEETEELLATSGLKLLLGMRHEQGKCDVFLSYRHEDIDIAQSVYDFLSDHLLQVFFDKMSLPELSESDYEIAIMKALDHSKHMILILSSLECLKSKWVELECRTFIHEMNEGRKEKANFLILVTDSVYQEIINSNKKCLPIEFRRCEIQRISEYRKSILKYLKV